MTYDGSACAGAIRMSSRAASKPAPKRSRCRGTCPTSSTAARKPIGTIFDEDTRIIFNPDGSYVWRAREWRRRDGARRTSKKPQYLIGAKGAKLYVRGTVRRHLHGVLARPTSRSRTTSSTRRIRARPLISHDFLALISGRDIRIAGPDVTGKGDLNIHAALFARRRFCIESVDTSKPAGRCSISTAASPPARISETEPRYATKLDYDKRFEYLRPASFPMTRRYEVESWDQDWEEVEKPDSRGRHHRHWRAPSSRFGREMTNLVPQTAIPRTLRAPPSGAG